MWSVSLKVGLVTSSEGRKMKAVGLLDKAEEAMPKISA
jgi:hypothetical protein